MADYIAIVYYTSEKLTKKQFQSLQLDDVLGFKVI